MKKLGALFIALTAFFIINNSTFSQPQFVIHLKGGYDLPLPDLKGDLTDSADQENLAAAAGGASYVLFDCYCFARLS